MKKFLLTVISTLVTASLFILPVSAAVTYTVVKGDTMWRIASKHEVGVSEMKRSNPHIKNPDLIYPGDVLNIPVLDDSITEYEQQVINLVNDIRVKNGLSKLTYDWQLARVARFKSEDMRDNSYFSHTSPVYGTPFQMIRNFGISYKSAGENIARGYATPEAVVNGWMNSSGHRANILNPSYTHIGIGYVSDGKYWTQMFISK